MELKRIVEAILFTSEKPLTPKELRGFLASAAEVSDDESAHTFKKTKEEQIQSVLEELRQEHDSAERSYRLTCTAGAWQFVTLPEYGPWLRGMLGKKTRPSRLSQPALETLAIIAYRQPLTRSQIEEIRGVSVDGVMQTLLDRELIEPAGRSDAVGRPVTYATTPHFLDYFGLASLNELPQADELRRIPLRDEEDNGGEASEEAATTAASEGTSGTGESTAADGSPDASAPEEGPQPEGEDPQPEPEGPVEEPPPSADPTESETDPVKAKTADHDFESNNHERGSKDQADPE